MSPHNFPARRLAASYAAGRAHLRRHNADRARLAFAERLLLETASTAPADPAHPPFVCSGDSVSAVTATPAPALTITPLEAAFLRRLIIETNPAFPDLHPGDANICDALRRKYRARLNASSQTDALADTSFATASASQPLPGADVSPAPVSQFNVP
jgi:hypothetical protein